jgi:DNA-binding response OmpR family regulator
MKPTILVIDDDEAVRYSIHRIMQREGFAVAVAADGREGLELLDRVFPALVITDLIMPEMEGLETITELRKRRSELPIIAISGGGRVIRPGYLDFAKKLGASDVLAKPFEPEDLVAAVKRQLRPIASPARSSQVRVLYDRALRADRPI